jgi:hypothetical protein
MMSISLSGRLSPRARQPNSAVGGKRHAAGAQRRFVLLQSGKEILAVHGSFMAQTAGGGAGASMALPAAGSHPRCNVRKRDQDFGRRQYISSRLASRYGVAPKLWPLPFDRQARTTTHQNPMIGQMYSSGLMYPKGYISQSTVLARSGGTGIVQQKALKNRDSNYCAKLLIFATHRKCLCHCHFWRFWSVKP